MDSFSFVSDVAYISASLVRITQVICGFTSEEVVMRCLCSCRNIEKLWIMQKYCEMVEEHRTGLDSLFERRGKTLEN